ncbi:MAG: hypothetical protein ACRDM1_11430 [Gaiellaceae bacterium]
MERILTNALAAHVGKQVLLRGWLHRQRRLSHATFVVLRDRAAQVVGAANVRVTTPFPQDRARLAP